MCRRLDDSYASLGLAQSDSVVLLSHETDQAVLDRPPPIFSAQELAHLEAESATLASELATMVDAVRTVERQMTEIRTLQSLISVRLGEQSEQIDVLLANATEALAAVETANGELERYREATSSYRLYMIVFLVTSALCLLFLNWYTDR